MNSKDEETNPLLVDDKDKIQTNQITETKEIIEWYEQWKNKRGRALLIVSICSFIRPTLGAFILPAIVYIIEDLNASVEMGALTISTFLLVFGCMPLVWGVLADKIGRKKILIFALASTTFCCLMCASSVNIYMLITFRGLQGVGFAATSVVSTATISDVYPKEIRGFALSVLNFAVLLGPIVGPITGGIIGEYFSWRYIFVCGAIVAAIVMFVVIFFLPETSRIQAKISLTKCNIFEPLKVLILPSVLIPAFTYGMSFSLVYLTQFFLPIELYNNYGWSKLQLGFSLLPIGACGMIGNFAGGKMSDFTLKKFGIGGRLLPGFISCVLSPIGVVLFVYTLKVNAIYCLLSTGIMSFTLSFAVPGFILFAVETKPQFSASIISCFLFLGFGVCSFIVISIGTPMVNAIGLKLTYLIFGGFVLLSLLPLFYQMYLYWGIKREF